MKYWYLLFRVNHVFALLKNLAFSSGATINWFKKHKRLHIKPTSIHHHTFSMPIFSNNF